MITINKNLFPAVEVALKRSKNLKMLCWFVDNFKSFKLGALKDDMEMCWKYLREWKENAFVSDKEWMNHAVKAYWFLVPAKVKTFENKNMSEAIKWLEEQTCRSLFKLRFHSKATNIWKSYSSKFFSII